MIIRPATMSDAPEMMSLLNQIISTGGTTAHQTPFNEARMRDEYITPDHNIACQVAEMDGGVVGFQSLVGPDANMKPTRDGWSFIATFVASNATGKGVGQHLFAATRAAANRAGIRYIDATIRADNVPGLRYYSGLGFVDYDRLVQVPLRDGTPVDRLRKRYDLS